MNILLCVTQMKMIDNGALQNFQVHLTIAVTQRNVNNMKSYQAGNYQVLLTMHCIGVVDRGV